jgi:hypothetical protein
VPREWLVGIAVGYLLLVAYMLVIVGQVLLAVLPGVVLVSTYLVWRFIRAVEAIADALQRIADDREG